MHSSPDLQAPFLKYLHSAVPGLGRMYGAKGSGESADLGVCSADAAEVEGAEAAGAAFEGTTCAAEI